MNIISDKSQIYEYYGPMKLKCEIKIFTLKN